MERVQVAATAANTVSYIYDGGPAGAVVAAAPTQNGVSVSATVLGFSFALHSWTKSR